MEFQGCDLKLLMDRCSWIMGGMLMTANLFLTNENETLFLGVPQD